MGGKKHKVLLSLSFFMVGWLAAAGIMSRFKPVCIPVGTVDILVYIRTWHKY